MVKKKVTYTDYNGVERTDNFYFNLSKAELIEMSMDADTLKSMVERNNPREIVAAMKNIILKAYGHKSDDGTRFIKSDEMALEFSQTEGFSELFYELSSNAELLNDFINGLIPADLSKKLPGSATANNN